MLHRYAHVEIDIEEEKAKKIPYEIRKVQTSYNNTEAIFKDSLDGHEQCVESSAHEFHQTEELLDLSGCLRGKEFFSKLDVAD